MAKRLSKFSNGEVSEIELENGAIVRVGDIDPVLNGETEFGSVIGFGEVMEGEVEVMMYEDGEGYSITVS